ncbi:MAG: hypothetical protein IPM98_03035 [Lewinellaceae bacterium]|nr:hypothetical protein [Lewinellaceae bacterium]
MEIANEIVPDLLVTDVMMPRKDGFEVCRTLRADARTGHIPIGDAHGQGRYGQQTRRPGARRRRLPSQAVQQS